MKKIFLLVAALLLSAVTASANGNRTEVDRRRLGQLR
jgi:hypothetical protein